MLRMLLIFLLTKSLIEQMCCNDFDIYVENDLAFYSQNVANCSEYFVYQRSGDFIIGKLTLPELYIGDTVKLQFYTVVLPHKPQFKGSLLPDESLEIVISKLKNRQPITYRIDFPLDAIVPELENIFINDIELCTAEPRIWNEKFTLEHTLQIAQDFFPVFDHNIYTIFFLEASTCGFVDTAVSSNEPTPFNSCSDAATNRGEYPWLVSIYRRRSTISDLICGGSLVSSKFILTAAHCYKQFGVTAEKIEVYMGCHNLTNQSEDNCVMKEIESINVHSDYNPELRFPVADLAILQLKESISFTLFIQPICLWSAPAIDATTITNQTGVVVSWGSINVDNILSVLPKKIQVDILTNLQCQLASLALTTVSTACAGHVPCNGDYGGGLLLYENGHWMLRGVISEIITYQQQYPFLEYTIYSDIAKYKSWLDNYIEQQEQILKEPVEAICGLTGTETQRENPWLTALYRKLSIGEMFICTGVLISSRSILAAAHCFDLTDNAILQPEFLRVYLGRYDLNSIAESNVMKREIATLIQHPEYEITSGLVDHNDIAVLHMSAAVGFTSYIKPICLWSESAVETDIVGQFATLASWNQFTIYDETATVPQTLEVNLMSFAECQPSGFNASLSAAYLCTSRFEDNTDGILMLKRDDRWILRGIGAGNLCYLYDLNALDFRVYLDIAEYLMWIQNEMLT